VGTVTATGYAFTSACFVMMFIPLTLLFYLRRNELLAILAKEENQGRDVLVDDTIHSIGVDDIRSFEDARDAKAASALA